MTSPVCDSKHVTFCYGSSLRTCLIFTQTQDGVHPPLLLEHCSFLHLLGLTAEFRPPFRRWFGFRGLGVLWTPQFTHSKPGPPGSGRTPVYRFLLHQPCLQPVQVSNCTVSVNHAGLARFMSVCERKNQGLSLYAHTCYNVSVSLSPVILRLKLSR